MPRLLIPLLLFSLSFIGLSFCETNQLDNVLRLVSQNGYMPQNQFSQSGLGTVYYVDKNHASSSDTNPGTESLPFLTIQKGINVLAPGDTLYVKSGSYNPTVDQYKNLQIEKKGSQSNYILISAYPGHRPIINVNSWNGVQLWNAEYIEFRGFEVRGIDDPPSVDLNNPQHFGNGISVFGNLGNKFIRVVDNHVHHVGGNGIGVSNSDQVLVLGNRVWHCTHRSDSGNSAISITHPKDFVASNNFGIVVAGNECFDNVNKFAFKYAGYITDGNGIIFDYYDNGDRSTYSKRCLAANNVAHSNGGRCIHAFNYHDVDVVQNTCYGNLRTSSLAGAHGELSFAQAAGIHIYNNIVYPTYATYGLTFFGTTPEGIADTNVLYNAQISGNGNSVINTILGDPSFVQASANFFNTDFGLRETSSAINTAKSSLNFDIDLDFRGTLRPQGSAFDIGAFEFISQGSPSQTPSSTQTASPTSTPTIATPSSTSSPTSSKPAPSFSSSPVPSATSTKTPQSSKTPSPIPSQSSFGTPTPSRTSSPEPTHTTSSLPSPSNGSNGGPPSSDYMPFNKLKQSGSGKIYVVDKNRANANDNNEGSETQPFLSLTKGVAVLQSGDTLYVKNGEYFPSGSSTYNLHIQKTGTSENWILISAYPGHKPKITVNTNNGVQIFSSSYVQFSGFEVVGQSSGNGNCIAAFGNPGNKFLRITDNDIHDCGGNGIVAGGADQLFIGRNRVWHVAHGLSYAGGSVVISTPGNLESSLSVPYGIVVAANDLRSNENGNANGIFLNYCGSDYHRKILVVNNVVYNNDGRCVHTFQSSNVDITFNTCFNNVKSSSLSSTYGEISAVSSGSNIRVYNNIVSGVAAVYGITYHWGALGEAMNNLLNGSTNVNTNGNFFDKNFVGNPKFINANLGGPPVNLKLQPGSAAIDVGDPSLGAQQIVVDVEGSSRPIGSGYDVGAYESL